MKPKILALLFLLFIILIIIGADSGSLSPALRGIYEFPGGDKVGHFILFGILAFLLAWAFPHPIQLGRASIPIVILALLVFAALEEYSQRFFSSRTSDIFDLTFSCLGIFAGTWLAGRKK